MRLEDALRKLYELENQLQQERGLWDQKQMLRDREEQEGKQRGDQRRQSALNREIR